MKIVHITTIDEGGAYKAVERIQKSMETVGIVSSILLRNKINKNSIGRVFLDKSFKIIISKIKNGINLLKKRGTISREILGSNIVNDIAVKEADIVVIHWINSFLSVSSLDHLFKTGKKIIIYIHDTWFFTGGCHVNLGCKRYQEGCGFCPYTNQNKKRDVSYKNFREKEKLFERYNVTIIGPSNDIVSNAKKSPIFNKKSIQCIPNPIDFKVFYPRENNNYLKKKYGIETDKKIILFGAAFNGTQNKEKGFFYLLNALKKLNNKYYLLIFGIADDTDLECIKQDYLLLGYIKDENEMAEIYSFSDVYVTPSLQESFGYTILEALSCGTPVVSYPNGGSNDLIHHQENGYLSEYESIDDLAKGIEFCLDAKNYKVLSKNARKSVEKYSYESVGLQYKSLLMSL